MNLAGDEHEEDDAIFDSSDEENRDESENDDEVIEENDTPNSERSNSTDDEDNEDSIEDNDDEDDDVSSISDDDFWPLMRPVIDQLEISLEMKSKWCLMWCGEDAINLSLYVKIPSDEDHATGSLLNYFRKQLPSQHFLVQSQQ